MTKVLIIEDEAILRAEVAEWLTFEDYEVITAADGLDGLQTALQHRPDFIICDITMPRLDGYGVLLELRSNPDTASIPFIFVTARAAHEDIRQGMSLGADDYITKPFTRLELLRAIESRLQKKAAVEENYGAEIKQWQQAFEQEHEQRMLKARIIAMFTHDFRNPLSAILASIGLLRNYEERLSQERKHTHLNKIEGSVRQLLQMLDDMLLVAQMEGGHLEYQPQSLNVAAFVEDIVEEFRIIYEDPEWLKFSTTLEIKCEIDPRLFRQIAGNLISNAIKYSPSDTDVTVLLMKTADTIELQVQDKGIGIPEEDLPRLFQPFQRASNVGTLKGTGLGLAIVRQAVALHGGDIVVESKIGVGTTVQVILPYTSSRRRAGAG